MARPVVGSIPRRPSPTASLAGPLSAYPRIVSTNPPGVETRTVGPTGAPLCGAADAYTHPPSTANPTGWRSTRLAEGGGNGAPCGLDVAPASPTLAVRCAR